MCELPYIFTACLFISVGGRQVYGGRTTKLVPYLEGLNFRVPDKDNPADWMIDVVSGLSPRYLTPSDLGSDVDASFKAPEDLFALWESQHSTCLDPQSQWNAPSVEFKAENADPAPSEELFNRVVPNTGVQTLYLLQRVFRQHETSSFIGIVAMLFFVGILFGFG